MSDPQESANIRTTRIAIIRKSVIYKSKEVVRSNRKSRKSRTHRAFGLDTTHRKDGDLAPSWGMMNVDTGRARYQWTDHTSCVITATHTYEELMYYDVSL